MLQFEIDISDQQSSLTVRHEWLREVIERVLVEEDVASAQISLALVDDAAIQRVNREYLGHDYPTDVISFVLSAPNDRDPLDEPSESEQSPSVRPSTSPSTRHLEGELVVSTQTALREAPSHGWLAEDELILYVVHGLLHLCGYDDLTEHARPIMRSRERQVLAFWQLTPTGLEA